MSSQAISVEGLSKQYRLGKAVRYKSIRDSIAGAATKPFRAIGHTLSGSAREPNKTDTIWALKDVSFEVDQGEVLGIIGRNGAGKSTLLKVLSRITEPTKGRAEVYGRVGSLLEVGTGFHPELTGRENMYLNGAILGMTRREITRKFDDIVAFAEVERFIDTAVKHYSSGMYLRLAFAVAAHLEPEILFVDEVLAVGDAAFQKKCLGKMGEVAAEGRTVLFVSHNMPAVSRLCTRTICLQGGMVVENGPTAEVVDRYLSEHLLHVGEKSWSLDDGAPGDDRVRLLGCRVIQDDRTSAVVDINRDAAIQIRLALLCECDDLVAGVSFYAADGTCLTANCDWRPNHLSPGVYLKEMSVPPRIFAEGTVNVLVQLVFYSPDRQSVVVPDALSLEMIDGGDPGAVRGRYLRRWPGVMRLGFDWGDFTPADEDLAS